MTIGLAQPFGQSFTPSLSAVGFVNLVLLGGFSGGGGTVYIDIRANSITGTILGTSQSVYVAQQTGGIVTFNFDNAVSVTPGTIYYFQPIVSPGGSNVGAPDITFLGYPGGTSFYQGNATPNQDLEFQEGIYVPEPSTWALLLLGVGALCFLRRKG